MRLSIEELNDVLNEELESIELRSHSRSSLIGTKLMREFVNVFANDGYSYVRYFHDSYDGLTVSAVVKGNDKHVFEFCGSMFLRDSSGWLELDHIDFQIALRRANYKRNNIGRKEFWDDIRFASIG